MTEPNEFGSRSSRGLYEFDCAQGKSRVLSLTVFTQNNLQGEARNVELEPIEWVYDAPGTVAEAQAQAACGT